MTRCFAFVLALLLASLSVASACSAGVPDRVSFSLRAEKSGEGIFASFNDFDRGRDRNEWSTSMPASQFAGLDVIGFRSAGTVPIHFSIVREAGRLDCSGRGGNSRGEGNCTFVADDNFAQLLESRGIGRPTREQSFSLMATDARRELIDTLAQARYPTPKLDEFISLSALEVSGDYIRGLAEVGYRPSSIDSLVQFKALDITPAYVGGFARIGMREIAPEELVQLKALDVTPEYVAGFQRLGYHDLTADRLVELKALDITPEFVEKVRGSGNPSPTVSELVDRKVLGSRR